MNHDENAAMSWLAADWPAPPNINAGVTLRSGGVSAGRYASFNLGDHVADDIRAVAANRARLGAMLQLPAQPQWLRQVHGTAVADADIVADVVPTADASVASRAGGICAVLTADCLPVLFCDRAGSCWGAAHAGWRGLAGGVLEATVASLPAAPAELLAWLGPAIGPQQFEVGEDVLAAFASQHAGDGSAFSPCAESGKYLADIYALARARLRRCGVRAVYGGDYCTVTDTARFFSYRRDGETGRMASLVWYRATS